MRIFILVVGICGFGLANAQEDSFFTDPSLLKPWEGSAFDLHYEHPDLVNIVQGIDSVMVDQPEIHLAADSRYRGAKGNDLKQLADVARLATIERLEAGGWITTSSLRMKGSRIATSSWSNR